MELNWQDIKIGFNEWQQKNGKVSTGQNSNETSIFSAEFMQYLKESGQADLQKLASYIGNMDDNDDGILTDKEIDDFLQGYETNNNTDIGGNGNTVSGNGSTPSGNIGPSTNTPPAKSYSTNTSANYDGMTVAQLESELATENANIENILAKMDAVKSGSDPAVQAQQTIADNAKTAYLDAVKQDSQLNNETKQKITDNANQITSLETTITSKESQISEYQQNQSKALNEANNYSMNAQSLRSQAASIPMPNSSDYKDEAGNINNQAYESAKANAEAKKEELNKQAEEAEKKASEKQQEAGAYEFKANKLKEELPGLENQLSQAKQTESELNQELIANASPETISLKDAYETAENNLETIKSQQLSNLEAEYNAAQNNMNTITQKLSEAKTKEAESTKQTTSANNNEDSSVNPLSSNVEDTASANNGYAYIDIKETTIQSSGNTQTDIANLNDAVAARNEEEASESVIHGMSDEEYAEFQQYMYEQYGIGTEQEYNYGNFQNVAVAMGESCSQEVRFRACCRSAQSYDSVLDLVLDQKLANAIKEIFKNDTDPNWETLCKSKRLRDEYGIVITKTSDRQFCVSLVDENGNVIQDEDGHLAQTYKNDYLMPDGQAQQNEIMTSACLDQMGFNCLSVLDLSSEEYEMIKKMAEMDNSQLGTSSNIKGNNISAINERTLGTKNMGEGTIVQDNSVWLSGYTDKVTGKTTNAKQRYNEFVHLRDSGYYKALGKGKNVNPADYMNGYSGSSGTSDSSNISDIGSNNNESNSNNLKVAISKAKFDALVKETMDEKGCTKSEATKIVEETYQIENSTEIK